MKQYIIIAVILFIFTGCNNRRIDPQVESSPMMTGFPASSNNSEIATRELDDTPDNQVKYIDYYGTYEGTIPAADASGIQTTLSLYDDNTYKLESVYLGKEKDNTFEEHGKYYVNGDLITLQANNQEEYYKIEDDSLLKLDMDKQEITGTLAENYRLSKK